jgi:hypothetical protein
MKNVSKVIGIIFVAGCFASFLFGISIFERDLPNRPQPELGRTYPINNHGVVLYLNKQEHLELMWSLALSIILFASAGIIDHFVDPFDRHKGEVLGKRRAPWNHRWGP